MSPYKSIFNRVHRQGRIPVLASFILALLVLALLSETLGWILLLLTLFIVYFFRDPVRVTPLLDGIAVSAADGIVTAIDARVPPRDLEMGDEVLLRISVFLSVLDVHVNRLPFAGRIAKLVYVPGRFVNATLEKASEENERQLMRIDLADGRSAAVVQIAGLIARRIVCEIEEGEEVEQGARFGIIRFGSRVDIYCPAGMRPKVAVGQTVVGGETIIAADGAGEERIEGRIS